MKDGKKVVITYGTFDLFHRGHYNILKRAKEYGDYLIVGVTGESYDIERGKLSVHDSIAERINKVMATGLVDEILIEEYLGQKIRDIIQNDVDVFVIGDDWKGKFDHIAEYCELVYLPRTKDISSTQLREEQDTRYEIGMITDRNDDNQLTQEAGAVSGFHLSTVYAEDRKLANQVKERFGIDESASSLEELIDRSDIVFVQTGIADRYEYIKMALESDKHVICGIPFSLDEEQHKELVELAEKRNLILLNSMKFFSTQTFAQLLWHIQGGLIGEIIKMECSISKNDRTIDYLFFELAAMAFAPVIKFMGSGYNDLKRDVVNENGQIEFATVMLNYPKGQAIINIGNRIRVENKVEIIGTRGTIKMDGDWWRGTGFTVTSIDGSAPRQYSTNISGNGFRLLIRDMLGLIRSEDRGYRLFTNDELLEVTKLLGRIK